MPPGIDARGPREAGTGYDGTHRLAGPVLGVPRVMVRSVVEVLGDLIQRRAPAEQDADRVEDALLPVVLAVLRVAERVGAAGLAARRCLGTATVAEVLHGQRQVRLREDADHLPDRGAHRFVGVVLMHGSEVARVDLSAERPDLGKDRLLHGQVASQPVEPSNQQHVGIALPQQRQGS